MRRLRRMQKMGETSKGDSKGESREDGSGQVVGQEIIFGQERRSVAIIRVIILSSIDDLDLDLGGTRNSYPMRP